MAGNHAVPRRDTRSAPAKTRRKKRLGFFNVSGGFDMYFFVLLMIILIVGLATLYSASHVYAFNYDGGDSYFYIRKQLLWVAIGMVAMLGASLVDYHVLHRFAIPLYIVALGLLGLALVLPSESGIQRWIRIPGLGQFQPSEFAKFALILLFAHIISLHYKKMKTFTKGFLPLSAILAVTCGLVIIEPHLSGTMLIAILGFMMMYVGGVRQGWLFLVLGAGVALVFVMVVVMGYEQDRIAVWLHPLESFANEITFEDGVSGRDHAWQTVQSLYAIGSGGILGQGPGNSRQKHLFLPEPQNDFIFAIFCEEMGLVGAVLVLILFALLVLRGLKIALRAPDKFGCMLAFGLTLQIGIQVALNVAVVSNLLPNTGISLPFFSYGGTSILMLMAQMGVVLSVSRQARMEKV